jgi:hypothetical protein
MVNHRKVAQLLSTPVVISLTGRFIHATENHEASDRLWRQPAIDIAANPIALRASV